MKYLISYSVNESVQKAKSLLNNIDMTDRDKNFIESLIKNYPSGYLGKIVSIYLKNKPLTQQGAYIDKIFKVLRELK